MIGLVIFAKVMSIVICELQYFCKACINIYVERYRLGRDIDRWIDRKKDRKVDRWLDR